ncbi:YfcC family protein [Dinghuibacter silviterrae]|uniref:Putative ion transporter superfamily protein YfcC n=1 Tax=Dinghuibacter silviterrae TaxID=1539049 RepID=A0A4R8DVF1_9BACT|nr:YfcC family protein [Dinghuibacter silviterrae]TDX02402.1 putative ion transporter superfamily protein YfcC [Dinghuibacter silviterrae]
MKLSFPHPLVILVSCILLAALCTYVVPAGQYQRSHDAATGQDVVVRGSYTRESSRPVSAWGLMMSVPRGIESGADVIISILIFGGTFCVIDKTGAFRAALLSLIRRTGRYRYLVMVLVGVAFAAGGAMDNMSEEIIALIPVIVFMTTRLGYSKIGAIAISTGCAVIGASFSPMNPFQVGIAQKIAQLPLLSGAGLRLLFLVPAVAFWITWVIRRTRVQEDPAAAGRDTAIANGGAARAREGMAGAIAGSRWRHALILLAVAASFATMVFGIIRRGWGFDEMTALFFVLGLVAGIVGRLGLRKTAEAFTEGAKEMTMAALVVGLARSVYLVLNEGHVIDTIVHGLFTPLQHLPLLLSAGGMMIAQLLIHVPVASVSGQAQLTIPLLTPLADLTGMSRQVMVMAFQYGAGICEMLGPTNGALMGVLAVAGVSFGEWWKFVWRPALILLALGLGAMAVGLAIGY